MAKCYYLEAAGDRTGPWQRPKLTEYGRMHLDEALAEMATDQICKWLTPPNRWQVVEKGLERFCRPSTHSEEMKSIRDAKAVARQAWKDSLTAAVAARKTIEEINTILNSEPK
jgi:hypothetical protein